MLTSIKRTLCRNRYVLWSPEVNNTPLNSLCSGLLNTFHIADINIPVISMPGFIDLMLEIDMLLEETLRCPTK